MLYYCNTVRWAWLDWGLSGWLTTLFQCFDTVGWVIRPVKPVGRITYILLVQALNPAQSINRSVCESWLLEVTTCASVCYIWKFSFQSGFWKKTFRCVIGFSDASTRDLKWEWETLLNASPAPPPQPIKPSLAVNDATLVQYYSSHIALRTNNMQTVCWEWESSCVLHVKAVMWRELVLHLLTYCFISHCVMWMLFSDLCSKVVAFPICDRINVVCKQ